MPSSVAFLDFDFDRPSLPLSLEKMLGILNQAGGWREPLKSYNAGYVGKCDEKCRLGTAYERNIC